MGGAAVRIGVAAGIASGPRLELAVGLDEAARDLDDELADADGLAMHLLVVGGVAVEFGLEVARQSDVHLRGRNLLFDPIKLHHNLLISCLSSRGPLTHLESALIVVAAITIPSAARQSP